MQKDILIEELKKVIVGKDEVLEMILAAVLADGHILLEDLPGTGKTTLALALARLFNIDYARMQFTADTLPSDVTGFMMFDKENGSFTFKKGPIFTNLFLADEINRTSPKTQSALLEVMEEAQVTIDAKTYHLERPFIVLATQNPYGSAGTNLLPQSQLDRFLIALSLGYPKIEDEIRLLKDRHHENPLVNVRKLVAKENLVRLQDFAKQVFVHDDIYEYVAKLINMTRRHESVKVGASPRGALALLKLAKARAVLYERDYVTVNDIEVLFINALSHRLVLKDSDESVLSLKRETILRSILESVKKPSIKDR